MFCPMIKGKCKGQECRDWDKDSQKCVEQISKERNQERDAKFDVLLSMQQEWLRLQRASEVWNKVQFNVILLNPTVPEEIKDAIRKAMAAQSSEVAERLLRDAGLLD